MPSHRCRPALIHEALFYSGDDEYVDGVRAFAHGLGDDSSLLVAVPEPKLELLRWALPGRSGSVQFADMGEQGANPARIIPFVRSFLDAHADGPVGFVCEPIWPERSPPEIAECVRHESLINEAFADTRAQILCAYDTLALDPGVLEGARWTHPTLVCRGERSESAEYSDPYATHSGEPLSGPTGYPFPISLVDGLAGFRSAVRLHAGATGLDPDRRAWFVIAANEAAANTLVHAGGRGTARIWDDGVELVCELSDIGVIEDPLAGRRAPSPDAENGRGLWLMNQLCDLVEVRSGPDGTVVRIHMRL